MTNSWMNEDGEPIMDGAAWRFEAQLDAEYEPDPYDDYDDYDEPDEEDEDEPEDDDDSPFVMEDQWLDGSWEE